jgi:hypothetical protein
MHYIIKVNINVNINGLVNIVKLLFIYYYNLHQFYICLNLKVIKSMQK